ncbi:3-phosphoshikimate 1-carboxyvinyltransferase [Methanobacterium petrolearium]|uniref:3-phosphoshikimate 1-carboxyvinyltransferase n=1 Tax=Methanobacterium petrolearium TaxID=710190 RepID=UPI001AE8F0A8|nr:3-phosphoshikimate 1-carboxyvinyltransferase [Methanobacterium petrolearium]BDZ71623.1 3-phosphoshikimate 1-carboxyvinyltransferase [Methanobacterium petrolearium]
MELRVEQAKRIEGNVKAPPSKSYTHRALLLACLAEGKSYLRDPLYSADTMATLEACQALGCQIDVDDDLCRVRGTGGNFKTPDDILDLKNSGTTLRFLTTMASLAPGHTMLTGDESLKGRPMQQLLDALQKLGVKAFSAHNNGLPPIAIESGFTGGKTDIKGDVSSQYISSILLSAPYAQKSVDLEVVGDFKSRPYVEMTLDIMEKFGVKVKQEGREHFHVDNQIYHAEDYTIEGDYSSASYLISAAATCNGKINIQNLFSDSKQGDKVILDIVKKMGGKILVEKDHVIINGTIDPNKGQSGTIDPNKGQSRTINTNNKQSTGELITCDLRGIDVNLENTPDLLPTVAALASVAQGTSHITGVEHARFKETDRVHTMALELSKLGVKVTEEKDGLTIQGGAHGGVVESHGDHRLVMALTLVGMVTGGVLIKDADAYRVSFPDFPQVMQELGCPVKVM